VSGAAPGERAGRLSAEAADVSNRPRVSTIISGETLNNNWPGALVELTDRKATHLRPVAEPQPRKLTVSREKRRLDAPETPAIILTRAPVDRFAVAIDSDAPDSPTR